MWLRDFFSKHFVDCRTMTYGYNAKLKNHSVNTIGSYTQRFLRDLARLREDTDPDRPIIFIGHSFGGILLRQTLIKMKNESFHDELLACILKATYGMIFFGTPHRGMSVENLLDSVDQTGYKSRKELLKEIQDLSNDLSHFVSFADMFKIYSFVETKQTAQIVVVSVDDSRNHPVSDPMY
jgi:pimeloyl-ACP methyl ester carboxylesterase